MKFSIDELPINEPIFNREWMLKNVLNFNEKELDMWEEQLRHERIIKQRILKLNKIINEINKK